MELTQIKICGNCNHTIICPVAHWTNFCPVCGHPLVDIQDQDGDPAREAIEEVIEKLRGGNDGPVNK